MIPVISIIIIIAIFILVNNQYKDVSMIEAHDNIHYLVRDLPDKQKAAETLSNIRKQLLILIGKLEKSHPQLHKRLLSRFQHEQLSEGSLDYKYTTYTVNKGEKMVFCLRDRESEKLHKFNLLMFVAIHELAHVASISEGHTDEFKQNFTILLEVAIKNNLYTNERFTENPQTYCGTLINTNGGV